MRIKDFKIGSRLYAGFIGVLLLTVIVGIIAYISISRITYQLKISELANQIIVDGGDSQAESLRYIIYGEENYFSNSQEKSKRINKQVEEVKELLLSDENRDVSNLIKNANKLYEEANIQFYNLEKSKEITNKQRVSIGLDASSRIGKIIELATDYSSSHKSDYLIVKATLMIEEARNKINEARIIASKYVNSHDPKLEKDLNDKIAQAKELLTDAKKLTSSNQIKKNITETLPVIQEYKNQFIHFERIVEKQDSTQEKQMANSKTLLTHTKNLRDGVYLYINKTKRGAFIFLIVAVFSSLVLGLLIGAIITKSITVPLSKGIQFANSIASGDLTKELSIDQKDEIGQLSNAMKNMLINLKNIVGSIIGGSESISNAATEVSGTSQEMSQGASEQASSVEEVSSTMEQISSNIEQSNDNAQTTSKISISAQKGIKEVNLSATKALEANRSIAEKIAIINDIAFQTNILALNAAVEAARAGEHGRGFAVVATEVRKLAEHSKDAAEEIVTLAQNSYKLTQEAGGKLNEMLPEIEKTNRLIEEIAAASQEQTNGATQVNNAIQQLNDVAQQNAAASEQLATSAEEMASQADSLKDTISFFKIPSGIKSTEPDFSYQRENKYENFGSLKQEKMKTGTSTKKGFKINLTSDTHLSDRENFETMEEIY